jgi:hypothetical protein
MSSSAIAEQDLVLQAALPGMLETAACVLCDFIVPGGYVPSRHFGRVTGARNADRRFAFGVSGRRTLAFSTYARRSIRRMALA